MKTLIYILIFFLIIELNQNVLAEPEENDFGIVNAWYNGQEATVRDVQLKVGEPAELKVEVVSKIDGHVDVKLTNPLKTESYEVVSGPSLIDERIGNLNVKSEWNATYIWIIKPTGKWTNGNAPINLFVQFTKAYDEYEHVKFTIANPYILDEQYSGPAPTRTASDPSPTDQAPSQGSPGFGVAGALLGIALVMIARRN
ncbi:MAG: sarcinarray family MAST domain-containing protein [Methanosarcinales archaeon]|nr:sarcinarray family MAST domain-containing protein [Methanosarcinales archaeon]MCD4798762.1 sarcinarray family MAST domain-containing protein [Methanosarcinales archaeon]MCD4808598.1 sarcinarray family MAST domain-containing protein [Methanosarcinales archaeon]